MQQLTPLFIQYVLNTYLAQQLNQQQEAGLFHFLEYLIQHQFISESAIRYFVLLREYEDMRQHGTYETPTEVVCALAERHHLHETSIWYVLNHQRARFEGKLPVPRAEATTREI